MASIEREIENGLLNAVSGITGLNFFTSERGTARTMPNIVVQATIGSEELGPFTGVFKTPATLTFTARADTISRTAFDAKFFDIVEQLYRSPDLASYITTATNITCYVAKVTGQSNAIEARNRTWNRAILLDITATAKKEFLPSNINGLSLWLKADAGVTLSGSDVTAWADQSGNGNNATSIVNPVYTASAKNGKPAITFSGEELMTTANIFNGADPRTMFAVYYIDNDSTPNTICGQTNDVEVVNGSFFLLQGRIDQNSNPYLATANDDLTGSSFVNQVWKIAMADYNGTTANLYANGANVGSDTFSWNTYNGTFCIGAYFTNDDIGSLQELLVGEVAEIVVYNRVLTTLERQQVEAYLNTKYAIY